MLKTRLHPQSPGPSLATASYFLVSQAITRMGDLREEKEELEGRQRETRGRECREAAER